MLGKSTKPPCPLYLELDEHRSLPLSVLYLDISGKQCATSGLTPIGLVNNILLLSRAGCS